MAKKPNDLPDYSDPPLFEVALAAQFQPLEQLNVFRLSEFWASKLRAQYPKTRERPLYNVPVEQFAPIKERSIDVELVDRPPAPRLWCLSESENRLVQFQNDLVAVNWRNQSQDEKYPRFEKIRESFRTLFHDLDAFVQSNALGSLNVIQSEVTYVNQIAEGAGWSEYSNLAEVLSVWSGKCSDSFLPEPENVFVATSFLMKIEGEGEPLGRLRVRVEPKRVGEDNRKMFQVTLSAKGPPMGGGLKGTMSFIDLGHEWIVRGFTSITTPKMHKIWGRLK